MSESQHGGRTAALALTALGVVFGDIGTSPLYTMKEIFAGPHPVPMTPDNIPLCQDRCRLLFEELCTVAGVPICLR